MNKYMNANEVIEFLEKELDRKEWLFSEFNKDNDDSMTHFYIGQITLLHNLIQQVKQSRTIHALLLRSM